MWRAHRLMTSFQRRQKGKTCTNNFGNMKFSFDAKNHFVSSMNGQCAMLAGQPPPLATENLLENT